MEQVHGRKKAQKAQKSGWRVKSSKGCWLGPQKSSEFELTSAGYGLPILHTITAAEPQKYSEKEPTHEARARELEVSHACFSVPSRGKIATKPHKNPMPLGRKSCRHA